ncbi:MAG: hypothetical protein H6752_10190 [Candidatus Omnitrophica bacterium]|nr:hypothetical protein [Candidatus Omnitrophota bacterium]
MSEPKWFLDAHRRRKTPSSATPLWKVVTQARATSTPILSLSDFEGGDLHLQRVDRLALTRGTDTGLTEDFDGSPRPIGRYDMGAFEFPLLRSDLNGDGEVDFTDLMILQSDWGKESGLEK